MPFEYRTICKPDNFRPFDTGLVQYSDCYCIWYHRICESVTNFDFNFLGISRTEWADIFEDIFANRSCLSFLLQQWAGDKGRNSKMFVQSMI